jgi:DNA-binding NarL/FixJ family response regulator
VPETRREQVWPLVAQGLTNSEIGIVLNITEKTVKQHVTTLMRERCLRNRVELALVFHGITLNRVDTVVSKPQPTDIAA